LKKDWRKVRGVLAKGCLKKMREEDRRGRGDTEGEKERRALFEDRGMEIEEVERRRGEGEG